MAPQQKTALNIVMVSRYASVKVWALMGFQGCMTFGEEGKEGEFFMSSVQSTMQIVCDRCASTYGQGSRGYPGRIPSPRTLRGELPLAID